MRHLGFRYHRILLDFASIAERLFRQHQCTGVMPIPDFLRARLAALTLLFTVAPGVLASPFIGAGDTALRHDIQRLADYGVITGPTTTWPLAWGPLIADISAFGVSSDTPLDVVDAIARVTARAAWDTRTEETFFNSRVSGAEKPMAVRSFEDTPRGRAELSLGLTYTSSWYTATLNAQVLDVAGEEEEFRADRSIIATALGNWSISVNTLDRWWGPGWDGSIILSNNARPIPAISIDRTFTDAFDTKLLSWLGPWDFSMHFGQFESDRFVPDAQFFGMRFNFRPLRSLEIGLSRAAQWCGEDRPCDLDTFFNLLVGRDNRGDDDVTGENEPGNQLAGLDLRWSTRVLGMPVAVYGQMIGEDEAGGLPSRYLGQLGIEGTGVWKDRWSYRWFGEYAGTACQFYESSKRYNCGYNHGTYRTGYRYRGRSVGHGADNDAELMSIGVVMLDQSETEWAVTLRFGELNAGGPPDDANTVTSTAKDLLSLDVRHARVFSFGEISAGLGFQQLDDATSDRTEDDIRFFLQWRSSY